ncbi:MAG TPA: cytochrome D1 domain-containing protein [Acidobacteriaceae bacterium]|nr:cytochrome D1 domain-containing protein [Acidobacteriaceae bacterium]
MRKASLFCSLLAIGSMAVLGLYAGAQGHSARSGAPLLLVANQGDRDLSIIDTAAAKQIAAVPEDAVTGHEVAASPDGKTAYVPIYGNTGVGKPGSDGSTMVVIDIPSQKVIHTVDFGHPVRPHRPVYDKNSGMLYVTTELDHTVTIINPHTLKIVGSIPTSQAESHMLVLSRDGKRGYTANVGPGTVSVLDMVGRKTIKVIPISATTQRIAISRDGRMVFTADQTKPQLAVIDTATNTIKAWVPLPAIGYGTAPTLDGRWLLVAMTGAKQVAVVDLHTLKVARTIDMPGGPTEILPNPDGRVAYVSCGHVHQVAVIDLSQWKVQSLIDAGKGADGLALAE